MEIFIRIVAGLLGCGLVFVVLRSGSKAALVNSASREIVTKTISRVLYSAMKCILARQKTYTEKQEVLNWFAPLFLFICIVMYFIIAMVGFALIYWSVWAEATLFASLISSGSALSTLGFYTPTSDHGKILAIFEGAMGLGVVVFLITFIPGYQSAIQVREEVSGRLYSRAKTTPDCESVYDWLAESGSMDNLDDFWNKWENFMRSVGDVHAQSPVLIFSPSIRRGQSWVVSVFAIMDTVNMASTTLHGQGKALAGVCLREGIGSLGEVAVAMRGFHKEKREELLTRPAYDGLCSRLEKRGYVIVADREKAWLEFRDNRAQYEQILLSLAESLFVELDPQLTHLAPHPGNGVIP